VDFLMVVPSGVLRMSADMKGVTETSMSLGLCNYCCTKGGQCTVLVRSSVNSARAAVDIKLAGLARLAGFHYSG
jgi:hypothetical protein